VLILTHNGIIRVLKGNVCLMLICISQCCVNNHLPILQAIDRRLKIWGNYIMIIDESVFVFHVIPFLSLTELQFLPYVARKWSIYMKSNEKYVYSLPLDFESREVLASRALDAGKVNILKSLDLQNPSSVLIHNIFRKKLWDVVETGIYAKWKFNELQMCKILEIFYDTETYQVYTENYKNSRNYAIRAEDLFDMSKVLHVGQESTCDLGYNNIYTNAFMELVNNNCVDIVATDLVYRDGDSQLRRLNERCYILRPGRYFDGYYNIRVNGLSNNFKVLLEGNWDTVDFDHVLRKNCIIPVNGLVWTDLGIHIVLDEEIDDITVTVTATIMDKDLRLTTSDYMIVIDNMCFGGGCFTKLKTESTLING